MNDRASVTQQEAPFGVAQWAAGHLNATFQQLVDFLAENLGLAPGETLIVASPSQNEPAKYVPIVWRNHETHLDRKPFFESYPNAVSFEISQDRLILVMFPQRVKITKQLEAEIKLSLNMICRHRENGIKSAVIASAVSSNDLNSFTFRAINGMRENYIYCDDVTILISDEARQSLYLSATTTKITGIKKADIVLDIDSINEAGRAFISNTLSNLDDGKIPYDSLDSYLLCADVTSRAYFPIKLTSLNPYISESKTLAPLGIARFTNIQRRHNQRKVPSIISQFDVHFVQYFIEVLFVLLQKHIQSQTSKFDFSRLSHGLGSNIDVAIKFTNIIRDILYEKIDEFNISTKYKLENNRIYNTEDVYSYLTDMTSFLDDAHFQLSKFEPGDGMINSREKIDDFHHSVLMPVIRMSESIASANSRKSPQINNLVEANSRELPPIVGSREGFVSVLRNLLENAIKYTANQRTNITVSFEVRTDTVILHFVDEGIGVPADRREQIFIEGYRDPGARSISNRGIGIGLSYARSVMRQAQGDLVCVASKRGAHFEMIMRRW